MRLTQPTVSMQIRELERLLGFELFERTTRRVELTKRGNAFLECAQRMVDETHRLKRAVVSLRQPDRGRISIGEAFYTYDFLERIALFERFISENGDIPIDTELRWQGEVLRDLHHGKIDLAIVMGIAVPRRELHQIALRRQGSECLYADDLRRVVLGRRPIELLVPAEMEIAQHNVVSPRDLQGQRVAVLTPGAGEPLNGPIQRMLEAAGAVAETPPDASGIGVARYGQQFRIPAVSLGWFDNHLPPGAKMVKRQIEGFEFFTEFVVLKNDDNEKPAVEAFWSTAQSLVNLPSA